MIYCSNTSDVMVLASKFHPLGAIVHAYSFESVFCSLQMPPKVGVLEHIFHLLWLEQMLDWQTCF